MIRLRALLVFAVGASFGCTALIGVRDIYLDESAEGGASSSSGNASSSSGGGGIDGGGTDGGGDCNTDLQTDSKNCGRCGRDCGGAACKEGRCEAITLAANLGNPSGIVVTADKVYVSLFTDRKVIELEKTAGGTPRDLVVETKDLWGVAVDGTTLYYALNDYTYAGDGGTYRGGIWKCTLPGCTAKTLVAAGDLPQNPLVHKGRIYFVSDGDNTVLEALPDGGSIVMDNSYDPFSLAADDTHLYYTSWQPAFYRIRLSDNFSESIGPQGMSGFGGVAVDDQRVYYSYAEGEDAGAGRVVSLEKANPATPKIEYGTGGNTLPRGLAVDANNIYWTNWGTYQDPSFISNADGDLRSCPKTGCPASGPNILVKGLARPYQIALDEKFVYFNVYTNPDSKTGSVQKVAKP